MWIAWRWFDKHQKVTERNKSAYRQEYHNANSPVDKSKHLKLISTIKNTLSLLFHLVSSEINEWVNDLYRLIRIQLINECISFQLSQSVCVFKSSICLSEKENHLILLDRLWRPLTFFTYQYYARLKHVQPMKDSDKKSRKCTCCNWKAILL